MKALFVIFSLVLPIFVFGKTLNRQEVYLNKDKSKVSLIDITEIHEGNRSTIVSDTIKSLYPSENAKAYMTQRNAEILMNEVSMVWLPDSLIPRRSHIFGEDKYQIYSLDVVGDQILYCYKGHYYQKVETGGIFVFCLFEAIIFMLMSLIGIYASKTKYLIVQIRWTFLFMFTFFTLAFFLSSFFSKCFTLFDSILLNLIAFLPAIIVTFLFRKTNN